MQILNLLALTTLIVARGASPPPIQSALLVSGYNSDRVHRFDPFDGTSLAQLGTAPGAQSARFGPHGDLYVVAEKTDQVLRFDGWTGVSLGAFVFDDPSTPQDETGGLDAPTAAVFGPGGDLFVASFSGNSVLRYDGDDGGFLGVFVSVSDGGLDGPDAGMVFGPDGHLYVPSFNSDQVLRYHGATGAFIDEFVAPGEGGLSRPRMLRFRSDGLLYVSSWLSNRILRYDPEGEFLDALVSTPRPTGFVFEVGTGHLLVTSDQSDTVRRFDGESGMILNQLVNSGADGLDGGTYLEYHPDAGLRLSRPTPGKAGAIARLAITGATSNGRVGLAIGRGGDSWGLPQCPTSYLGVRDPRFLWGEADSRGELELELSIHASASGERIWLQVLDRDSCRVSNLVVHSVP